jgi:hypothetical protein
VITVTSYDLLNSSDIQQLLVNIAYKYDISLDRLDATFLLAVEGTETEPKIYSVSVTILGSTSK